MYIDSSLKKKLEEKYQDEQVFVVPFEQVKHIKDRFTPSDEDIEHLNKYDTMGRYILRHDAEYNPSFQQLIPYVLISDPEGEKFFVSKRTSGDARLQNRYALGFGGHINPEDGSFSVILSAMYRELNEEVDIELSEESDIKFIGYVRDLTSDTKDHLGFVFIVKAESVKIKEKDKLQGVWMTKKELVDNYFHFEGWSRYIIDYFYENSNL